MPFKRLITEKKQPGRPGRLSEARGGSSRSLEEVAEMEGPTPAKRTRKGKSATATTSTPKGRRPKGPEKRVRRLSKSSEQIGRLDVGLGG